MLDVPNHDPQKMQPGASPNKNHIAYHSSVVKFRRIDDSKRKKMTHSELHYPSEAQKFFDSGRTIHNK
jgi:hypothetical protein